MPIEMAFVLGMFFLGMLNHKDYEKGGCHDPAKIEEARHHKK